MRILDQRFAAVYNDVSRFPTIWHVAEEMGVTTKTVQNRAGEMRSLFDMDTPNIPELIVRQSGERTCAPPADCVIEVDDVEAEEPFEFRHRDPVKAVNIAAKKSGTRYFIFSYAQNETEIHHGFVDNLEAYAAWLGNCEIIISGGTYNKSLFEDHGSGEAIFHARIAEYITLDRINIGDGLTFCGEMNISPTAVSPLTGFDAYTRKRWGIFPHTKQHLKTIATAKRERSKQIMTTGAVTMHNYIQKKAGHKASFHHVLGAVIVELQADGAYFCRHIQADGSAASDGGFFDLDRRIENGEVTVDHRVEALTYGDIHEEKLDPEVALTTWGYDTVTRNTISSDTLLDYLRPAHQFFHDLSDFTPRNHHNIKDPHHLFMTHEYGTDDVEAALMGASTFLDRTQRPGTKSVVVQSNHDNALMTWLKTGDYRIDPANAVFFLATQLECYTQMQEGIKNPPIFEYVMRDFHFDGLKDVIFVSEDDSYLTCGDIENAMHGHLGANGSRGNVKQFAQVGYKSNTGHSHSPAIVDGAYVAGVSGKLDMGYNKGLSSWEHAHIVTYPNGARAILSMMNGRWHGKRPQPRKPRR